MVRIRWRYMLQVLVYPVTLLFGNVHVEGDGPFDGGLKKGTPRKSFQSRVEFRMGGVSPV